MGYGELTHANLSLEQQEGETLNLNLSLKFGDFC